MCIHFICNSLKRQKQLLNTELLIEQMMLSSPPQNEVLGIKDDSEKTLLKAKTVSVGF